MKTTLPTNLRSVILFCLIFAAFSLLPYYAIADDGVFYSIGNTLIPIHESTISLKKEILTLKRVDTLLYVDVYFEFENPGETRQETVGFVTPPGGEPERRFNEPFVKDFKVVVNDSSLSYKMSRYEETGFHIPKSYTKAVLDTGDFIYYFPATFHHGVNIVHHTYALLGGASSDVQEYYWYSLTTGKLWANHEMGDFTLSIDMGPDVFFFLPSTFWKSGKNIPWKVEGVGAISQPFHEHSSLFPAGLRMVKLHSGVVTCHLLHFRPDYDIGFGRLWRYAESNYWNKNGKSTTFHQSLASLYAEDLETAHYNDTNEFHHVSNSSLRLLENLPFAWQDCEFKDRKLTKTFTSYTWYLPVKGRIPDEKRLSHDEVVFLEQVREERRRRGR